MQKVWNTVTMKIDLYIITVALILTSSSLASAEKILLKCPYLFFKYETDFLGVDKKVQQKTNSGSDWWDFCKNPSKLDMSGYRAACGHSTKSYTRINYNKIIAKVQKFTCPMGTQIPNRPSFMDSDENAGKEVQTISISAVLESDTSKEARLKKHFTKNDCTFFGLKIEIPTIQISSDGKEWSDVLFPEFYPFQYNNGYERLVFGTLDESLFPIKYGTHYEEIIDFETRTHTRRSWQINPDTEKKMGDLSSTYTDECGKFE